MKYYYKFNPTSLRLSYVVLKSLINLFYTKSIHIILWYFHIHGNLNLNLLLKQLADVAFCQLCALYLCPIYAYI